MTPVLLHRGTRRAAVGRKKKWKSPVRRRRGPENPSTQYSAHAKPSVHPLKVDSRISEAHITWAVRLKLRMTILLKRKRTAEPSIQLHGATAFETAWRAPGQAHRGRPSLNTTKQNGSCLCAISQLGSCTSCRSWNYGDSAFNLRFDANTLSGIAVTVHFHS